MTKITAIKTAIDMLNRTIELRNAGLKLKFHKTALLNLLCDHGSELPADIAWLVSRAIRSASGVAFFNRAADALAQATNRLATEEHNQAMADKAFRAFWAAGEYSVMENALEAYNAMRDEALAMDAVMVKPVQGEYLDAMAEAVPVPRRIRQFYFYDAEDRAAIVEEDHAEALAINSGEVYLVEQGEDFATFGNVKM